MNMSLMDREREMGKEAYPREKARNIWEEAERRSEKR